MTKYEKLAESIADSSHWTTTVMTFEVGARGFVAKSARSNCLKLGLSYQVTDALLKEMSRMSIRCSHFIWINRDNQGWETPAMGL